MPDIYFENLSTDEKADLPTLGNEYKEQPLDLTLMPPDTKQRPEPAASQETVVDSLMAELGRLFESGSDAITPKDASSPVQRARPAANVLAFNIGGAKLHMTPEETKKAMTSNGYNLIYEDKVYPNMFKTYEIERCKDSGFYYKEEIAACLKQAENAEGNKASFTKKMEFVRKTPGKKEQITVFFASRINDNMAYRVDYVDYGDASLQSDKTAVYLKNKRREEFWNALNNNFGAPDSTDGMVLWGRNGIMMKAEMVGSSLDARISMADGGLIDNEIQMQTKDYAPKPAQLSFNIAPANVQ